MSILNIFPEDNKAEYCFIKEECTYPAQHFAYLLLKLEYLRFHKKELLSYAKSLEEDYDDIAQLFTVSRRISMTELSISDTKDKLLMGYNSALKQVLRTPSKDSEMREFAEQIIFRKKEIFDYIEKE
ncbi:MAG: hypothetical protein JXA60_06375 [Candidatus Coatesbacteria bacterium]|nr:hypothetical protein [Candidatus Coatesbacteria bacterium]